MVHRKNRRNVSLETTKSTERWFWYDNKFFIVLLYCLPLLRGIARPLWLSYPSIGEVKQWWPLDWVAIIYPLFATYLLWLLAREYLHHEYIAVKTLIYTLKATLLLFVSSIVFYALKLFILWKDDPVGKYLLWSPNSYYLIKVWEFARPYVMHVFAGFLFGAFFLLLYRVTLGRVVAKEEILLVVLLGCIHGIERTLLVIVFAFGLTVLWSMFQKLLKKQEVFMRVAPSLFIASFIMLLIG